MTVYGASATRDRQGWFFGLTGPQVFLVLAAAFPCWLAMSVGQWRALLGLVPLWFGTGAELRAPLAAVAAGGLASATGLTLLVLPVLFVRLGGSKR